MFIMMMTISRETITIGYLVIHIINKALKFNLRAGGMPPDHPSTSMLRMHACFGHSMSAQAFKAKGICTT